MSTDFEHQKISKSQQPLKQLNNNNNTHNNNNNNNNNNFIYIALISRAHGALQCKKKKTGCFRRLCKKGKEMK